MGMGVDPILDEAIGEAGALLAVAYRRHARVRQVRPPEAPFPSTEDLDNTGKVSANELTLTRRRKESRRS